MKKTNKQLLQELDKLAVLRTVFAAVMMVNGLILSLHIFGVL